MSIIFVVDTNQYSGNFDREMCAHMTGVLSYSNVGHEHSKNYLEKYGKPMDGVILINEDHYRTPVSLIVTPGMRNNGLGFEFKEGEEDLAVKEFKESVKFNANMRIAQIDRILQRTKNPKHIESALQEKEKCLKEIKDIELIKTITTYPAYMSIGIHFSTLTKENIEILKIRAEEFANKTDDLNITGFRIIYGNETLKG